VTVVVPSSPSSQEAVAYRAIIEALIRNQIRPGDQLLETALAENLGLSRTPVASALGRLHAEGFLEKRSKRGYLIPGPRPEDARQVFAVRRDLEGLAAEEAAARFRSGPTADLEGALRELEGAPGRLDAEQAASANEAFHLGIAQLSGNAYLARFIPQVFWRSNLYIRSFDGFFRVFSDGFYADRVNGIPVQNSPGEHRGILEAIRTADGERAGRLMREHIQRTYDRMMGFLQP
jgi:DNA-binding GntR family transcriptional regulator